MAAAFDDQIRLIDLLEFNRQLEGMRVAGIPLSWEGDDSAGVLKAESERVANQIAIQVGQGRPFLEAWKSIPNLSLPYQAAFLGWILSDRSPMAFDLIKSDAAKFRQSRRLWFLNFQLGFVFALALVVLAVWLSFGQMSLIYNNSKLQVGPLSRILETLQQKPAYSLAGGLLLLVFWGSLLHLVKIRLAKLSQAVSSRQSDARRKWIKSLFMKLISSANRSTAEAEEIFESLVSSTTTVGIQPTVAVEYSSKPVADPFVRDSAYFWPARSGYILWSAERAVEQRLFYRISTLPYTIYFVGSGVVVFCVGLLVFGPLIELLYAIVDATVVPGAF